MSRYALADMISTNPFVILGQRHNRKYLSPVSVDKGVVLMPGMLFMNLPVKKEPPLP
jgi:hypothetical protein